MPDPRAGRDAAHARSGQHGSRMALVLLLVFVLALLAVRIGVAGGIPRVGLGVRGAEKGALVVGGGSVGCAGRTAGRWGIGALGGRSMCGRVPLAAACCLVYVVPFLAVLVELGDPAWRHGGRGAVLGLLVGGVLCGRCWGLWEWRVVWR